MLPDGKTVCLVPAPAKIGCKEQLDHGWPRKSKRELRATFDRVLGESADQLEVYDQVRACVRYAFLGDARLDPSFRSVVSDPSFWMAAMMIHSRDELW